MKKDAKMFSYLRQEGRMPLTKLSRKIGLPVSTIHERLKKHVSTGLVRSSLLLDFAKLGLSARAYILLAVDHDQKADLMTHLSKNQHVNNLFRINNGWSMMVECIFKDMFSLESFIDTIEQKFQIKQKQVCYVLEEIKRESFLSVPELAESIF